jgi:hypothetical protein
MAPICALATLQVDSTIEPENTISPLAAKADAEWSAKPLKQLAMMTIEEILMSMYSLRPANSRRVRVRLGSIPPPHWLPHHGSGVRGMRNYTINQ